MLQLLPDVGPSLSPFLLSSTVSLHVLLVTDVGVRQLGFTWIALRSAGQLKDKLWEKRKMKITSGHFTLTKWMPGLSPVALVLPSRSLVSEL